MIEYRRKNVLVREASEQPFTPIIRQQSNASFPTGRMLGLVRLDRSLNFNKRRVTNAGKNTVAGYKNEQLKVEERQK
ncbi:hypothetical protein RUM43_000452 [Polyplax serrata]|uniref:Uncharacterized protein n=1 Tax=Polyplax serrata TaxID=468196 RepID=A0AAN8XP20_POLSC